MHWLLIGYMFLFIHRPFEVWPALGEMRVERIYMAVTVTAWLFAGGKRWLPNIQHAAYAALAGSVVLAWVLSPWMDSTQPRVEDWFKILVFYGLLVTTVSDEKALKKIVAGFVAVMAVYLAHSLKEYVAGRHTYRMGIARMLGVDSTLGDPNSFGASIVFVLPFITALWRSGVGGRLGRLALAGYFGLSVLCILLTGSRSSLLGLSLWGLILVLGSPKRWKILPALLVAAPLVFVALPASLQTRFETIIDSDVGPANAKESGEGRVLGLLTGLKLWENSPLTGVGPGAWRPATRSSIEAHNLYGQLVGELGGLGLGAFCLMLAGFALNFRAMKRVRDRHPEWGDDLPTQVGSAVGVGVVLLLFMGNFGHNLFRFSWLWYGGFILIARHCLEVRERAAQWDALHAGDEDDAEDGESEWADGGDPDAEALPAGWQAHPGHGWPGEVAAAGAGR